MQRRERACVKRGAASASASVSALLLPLLAGGGWEGVTLLIFEAKSNPSPTLPCKQGREHLSRATQLAGSGFTLLWLCFCSGFAFDSASLQVHASACCSTTPCAAYPHALSEHAMPGSHYGRVFSWLLLFGQAKEKLLALRRRTKRSALKPSTDRTVMRRALGPCLRRDD